MIKRLGHVALVVENMEKSLHFYTGILGFQRAFDIKDDNDNPWIEYIKVTNGQFIELFYGGKKEKEVEFWDFKAVNINHICLEVDDIDEIASHLKSYGLTLDIEPQVGKDHNKQCWVSDPDGNRIEFMQLDPKSPHMNC